MLGVLCPYDRDLLQGYSNVRVLWVTTDNKIVVPDFSPSVADGQEIPEDIIYILLILMQTFS